MMRRYNYGRPILYLCSSGDQKKLRRIRQGWSGTIAGVHPPCCSSTLFVDNGDRETIGSMWPDELWVLSVTRIGLSSTSMSMVRLTTVSKVLPEISTSRTSATPHDGGDSWSLANWFHTRIVQTLAAVQQPSIDLRPQKLRSIVAGR